MTREEREALAQLSGRVRDELARGRAEEWLDRAAVGAAVGPMPEAPAWRAWHAADPGGFASHVRGRIAEARAREARRAAPAAEDADGADGHGAALAVAVGALLAVVVLAAVVRRRRRRRRPALASPSPRPAPSGTRPAPSPAPRLLHPLW